MTLYEMTEIARKLYAMFEADQIDEQVVSDTLEGIGIDEKLEDYCKVIRQFEAEAEVYKAEKDRFSAKEKKARKAVERLENAILRYLISAGKDGQKSGVFEVKRSQSRSANIVDASVIPAQYRKPQPDSIDVAGVRKALLNGEQVAGAVLQVNENLSIK